MAFDRGTARLHLASSAPEGDDSGNALVIRKQPVDEWYKDQGGRKALLSTTVASPVPLSSAVPLACRLLLESGMPPADSSSLLQIEGLSKTDMLALGPDARELTIKFRILKVSRNFDNSRFVLEISPDYSRCASTPPAHERLGTVRTFPILVKSKRRRPQARQGEASASSSSSSSSAVASSSAAASVPARGPSDAHARHWAASPADDASSMLSRILAEQARQSRLLAAVAQNQAKILSLLGARGAAGMEEFDDDGVPPTPPGRSAFRREGTDSSTSSVGSEVTMLSTGADGSGRALRSLPPAAYPMPSGPPGLSGAYAVSSGLPLPSMAGYAAALPSVPPQRLVHAHAHGFKSGGVDSLLAAAEATESSAKRSRHENF